MRLVTSWPQTLRSFRAFARSGGVGCVRLWRLRSFFFPRGEGRWGLQSRDARDERGARVSDFGAFRCSRGRSGGVPWESAAHTGAIYQLAFSRFHSAV